MGAARPQHYRFAHQVLRKAFLEDPARIMDLLQVYGEQVVQVCWESAGEGQAPGDLVLPVGLGLQMRGILGGGQAALVSLPAPGRVTEAYFVAMVFQPAAPGEAPLARYFTLEWGLSGEGTPRTMLCEWMAAAHLNYGDGPAPAAESFLQVVCRRCGLALAPVAAPAEALPALLLAAMEPGDWPAVQAIYREGIATGNATFETEAPTWEAFDAAHLPIGRLVARLGPRVVGWAALSPASARACYAGVAEVSIYVAEAARRQGVGTALLQALIAASEQAGLWTLQAGILRENEASLRLHQQCGFRIVGVRERIAQLADVWRDVVLMERRRA